MSLTPRQAATVFFGTALFGVLTFASGLMIGVGISTIVPVPPGLAPSVAKEPVLPAGKPAGAGAAPIAAASPAPASTASVTVPMPPAVASAAGAKAEAAQAAAAPEGPAPVPVKDFRVGLPPELGPVSPLRGRMVEAALSAPRSLAVAPPAPVGSDAAPAPTLPPPPATATAAAPPFLFSVQVGSFLVKGNAERLAEELGKRGYAARVLQLAPSAGEPAWYPVVLAPVGDVAAVTRLAQEFAASEGRHAEVVSWLAAK
jgi:SPOR domain